MYRFNHIKFLAICLIITGFAASCERNRTNNDFSENDSTLVTPDTSRVVLEESEEPDSTSFDLLVDSYENPERNSWQHPEVVIKKINNPMDKVVADIGAGTGYFTFKLARWCKGVIALEIDKDFIEYLEERRTELPRPISSKITIRETPADSAALRSGEANAVLVVNTYYFISDRISYFEDVLKVLSQEGEILVVDYLDKELPEEATYVRKVKWQTVKSELQAAGFKNMEVDTTSLPYQYIIKGYK